MKLKINLVTLRVLTTAELASIAGAVATSLCNAEIDSPGRVKID